MGTIGVVHCPSCGADDTRVADSRTAGDGAAVRRRRHCVECSHRFTTFERMEEVPLCVQKSSGVQEPFERSKIESGVRAASKGRGIDDAAISTLIAEVEDEARLSGPVVSSTQLGVAVLERLRLVDEVAYLRFASVYKGFDGAADFHREIELLTKAD